VPVIKLGWIVVALAVTTSSTIHAQVIPLESQGTSPYPGFGAYCSSVPDVNGDGFGDVLVGVPREWVGDPPNNRGAAYVFSGRDGSVIYQVVSPRAVPGGNFGRAVAGSPDLDGDGLGDLIVGAYSENSAYVFSGADGSLLYDLRPGQSAGRFGTGVASIPDMNDDGISDIAVGADGYSAERGQVYLFSGATGERLVQFGHPRPFSGADFGAVLAGIPDLDGDGAGDILVGCPNEPIGIPGQYVGFGHCYVFSGRTGTLIREIDPPEPPVGWIGQSITGIPDIDGDGAGDYAIGTPNRSRAFGEPDASVYVYSGRTGDLLRTLHSPIGQKRWYGGSVAGTPDLDGDGRGDLIVGAPYDQWPGSPPRAGAVYIYSGATFRLLNHFVSPRPGWDPVNQFGSNTGTVVSAVPDSSGDGRVEIVAGAPWDCSNNPGPCPPDQPGRFYIFPSCAGDYNYDGFLNSQDFFDFIAAFFAGLPGGDFNRNGSRDSQDFFDFLTAFFAGC